MPPHFLKKNEETQQIYSLFTDVSFSKHFYEFLDRQLVHLIKIKTGLSPSPRFRIAPNWSVTVYEPNHISRLNLKICIENTTKYDISFCWRSHTGKQVSINDEFFNEFDLECWLEGLTPEKYYFDLFLNGKNKSLFERKKLPLNLEIGDYDHAMLVYIKLKDSTVSFDICKRIDECIESFNELADAQASGSDGAIMQAVGNWQITQIEDERLQLYLDFASPQILKKIINDLAKYDVVVGLEMKPTNVTI